ncbi:CNP1-like family protein [Rhodoferax sp.]|uniref:CNP1-like family protein n=1 Tax=Rhodoferax sp. TaxID=50421 RepID=UPI0027453FD0|nr:CNP1-like family protein [Rhodoferax sp.]
MRSKFLLLLILLTGWTAAIGQAPTPGVDWQESDAPLAPAFSDTGLVPIAMPANAALQYGVDPNTLTITRDGVVRYVMVASSTTGVRNVMYEGIRCASSEVKTYARQNAAGQWAPVSEPQWRPLQGGNAVTAHAMALARQGVCSGRTVGADSAGALVKKLRYWKPDPR